MPLPNPPVPGLMIGTTVRQSQFRGRTAQFLWSPHRTHSDGPAMLQFSLCGRQGSGQTVLLILEKMPNQIGKGQHMLGWAGGRRIGYRVAEGKLGSERTNHNTEFEPCPLCNGLYGSSGHRPSDCILCWLLPEFVPPCSGLLVQMAG